MQRLYQPSTVADSCEANPFTMTATELRTDLLQQIEQADEKLLRVISSVLEAVKVEYVAEEETTVFVADSEEEAEKMAAYEATLKPMSKAEFYADINESIEQYERGEYFTLDEVEQDTAA